MKLDERYSNKHIEASEIKRYTGYLEVMESYGEEFAKRFAKEAMTDFVRWYIQKSINSSMRYAEELVRRDLKAADERNGSLSLEAVLKAETQASTAAYVMDEYLAQASYKNKGNYGKGKKRAV